MGLQKLSYLDGLVKEYCANLGSRSTYSALLEASLSVVRWGGYIRDIGQHSQVIIGANSQAPQAM